MTKQAIVTAIVADIAGARMCLRWSKIKDRRYWYGKIDGLVELLQKVDPTNAEFGTV